MASAPIRVATTTAAAAITMRRCGSGTDGAAAGCGSRPLLGLAPSAGAGCSCGSGFGAGLATAGAGRARDLRGGHPVGRALVPDVVGGLQMAQLDELAELAVGDGTVLLDRPSRCTRSSAWPPRKRDTGRAIVHCHVPALPHILARRTAARAPSAELSGATVRSSPQRPCDAQALHRAAVVGQVPVAVRGAQIARRVVPGAAAHDAPRAVSRAPRRSVAADCPRWPRSSSRRSSPRRCRARRRAPTGWGGSCRPAPSAAATRPCRPRRRRFCRRSWPIGRDRGAPPERRRGAGPRHVLALGLGEQAVGLARPLPTARRRRPGHRRD